MVKTKYIRKVSVGVLAMCLFFAIFNSIICNEKPIVVKLDDIWTFPALREMGVDLGLAQKENFIGERDYTKASFIVYPPIRYSYDLINRQGSQFEQPLTSGQNGIHFFGTDRLGRDVFAGITRGFYIAFKVGCISLFFASIIGVFFGLFMGYFGDKGVRWNVVELLIFIIGVVLLLFYLIYPLTASIAMNVGLLLLMVLVIFGLMVLFSKSSLKKHTIPIDFIGLKVIELFKSLPTLVVLLAALPLFSSRGSLNIIIILIFLSWKNFARHSRAETYSIKEKEFVLNAKAQGQKDITIIIHQILPNILPTILVLASFTFISLILVESSLSFLGFGLPIGEVSWGSLLAEGRSSPKAWWLSVFPGLCLLIVILCINTLVDQKVNLEE